MQLRLYSTTERMTAIAGVVSGAAVSAVLAPKDSWFLPNFLSYWVPQLCVLGFFCLRPPRPSVFAGLAFALALYLALFGSWLLSRQRAESLAWLGYLFSLPGAIIGALLAIIFLSHRRENRAVAIGATVAAFTFIGIAANQILVCSTVMYCLGP